MPKFFLRNGSHFEIRDESLYIWNAKDNVFINEENPIPYHSRIFLDNGDSIGIHDNKIFIDSVKTKVYIDSVLSYWLFQSFVSEVFQNFCLDAESIEKEKFSDDKYYVVATFNVSGFNFKAISPAHPKGTYKLVFRNVLPKSIEQKGNPLLKLQNDIIKTVEQYGYTLDMGDTFNMMTLKTSKFDMNNMLHMLYGLKSLNLVTEENDNSENHTA